MQLKQMGENVT